MKTAKTDVCTRETVDWGEREGEEGENESVYDANNSHIIERPQNECAPCGFYQPKDWLNTSRPNVLKLRNAFLGNVSKKETEKTSRKRRRKNPEAGSKNCAGSSCVNGLHIADINSDMLWQVSVGPLPPSPNRLSCRGIEHVLACATVNINTRTHARIYVCSYMCLLESLINISHSDRVQWNSLSYQLAECSWVIDSFIPNEFEFCEILFDLGRGPLTQLNKVYSVRPHRMCHESVKSK